MAWGRRFRRGGGGGRVVVVRGGGGRGRRGGGGRTPVRVKRAALFGAVAALVMLLCAPRIREKVIATFDRWFPNMRA